MENENNAKSHRFKPNYNERRPFLSILLRALQGLVSIIVILLVGLTFYHLTKKMNVTGAPVALIYATVAAGVVVTLLHLPYVFWRLPRSVHWVPYVGILVLFWLAWASFEGASDAYDRTPEGAREAAAQAKQDQQAAVDDAERAKQLAVAERQNREAAVVMEEAERTVAEAEQRLAELEACFSSFRHRLPDFEKAVASSLHNPKSFEHVETVLTTPDADGRNVAMQFRAENAFGAIRTGYIRVQLVADGCELQNIGTPE